tara:strand:+ start:13425 stop:27824 length:14400 start_codon:yes stop_codon:yes gene_type:complete
MADLDIKMPGPDYNLKDRIIKDAVDVNPIDTSLPYSSIDDLIPDMRNQVSDEYDRSVSMYKGLMDGISASTLANISGGAEASVINAAPPIQPGSAQALDDIWSKPLETQVELPNVLWANSRAINFDKVYASDIFSDVGFTPYANMDKVLNANETSGDYLGRMIPQLQRLFRSGRFSNYRSAADVFDGSYLSDPDLEGAFTMEDGMRIGGSTTGNLGGFLGNTALNWGYSAGIIYQIAVEEVIGAGVAALASVPSGGGSLAAYGALTLKNLATLTRLPKTIMNGFKASANLFKNFNNIRYSKDFWDIARTGGNFTAKLISPEMAHTIKNWKTTGNTFQNAYNIGKNTEVFGAFYRDMRMYNAALAESKMEAGLVYNTVLENGMRYSNFRNNGNGISPEEMTKIQTAASQASWKTLAPNFALIAASNRVVFKNVFGSWAKKLNQGTATTLARVLRNGPTSYIKKSKWLLKSIPQEIKAGFKVASWKGAAKTTGGVMLRYGSSGMVEGLQEVSQEAISAATGGYYSAILRDPTAGGKLSMSGFYGAAGDEIFTKQGLETFASGFLIGGMMGPYQQILFEGIPAIYSTVRSKVANSKKFNPMFDQEIVDYAKQQRETEEQMIDDVVAQANEMGTQVEQINLMLDPVKMSAALQDQAAGIANMSIALNSKYDYMNNRNFTSFDNLYHKYQRGLMGIYKEMVTDFSKMSDTEIGEAFNKKDFGRNPEKLRNKFVEELTRINEFGERIASKKTDKLFEDKKLDLSEYDKSSKAYRDAFFHNRAIDQAKMLYIFSKESFLDAVKRQMEIEQSFENEPIFTKQKYGDIRVLSNAESIKTEIDQLDKELKAKEDAGVPATELKKDKRKRKDLKRYYDILTDPKNLTKKGFFNRAKTKSIKGALKTYLNGIAEDKSDYVNEEVIDDVLSKLIDHSSLQEDAFAFSQTVNIMANPEVTAEIVQRNVEYFEFLFKNRKEVYRSQTEQYISSLKKNELINNIAEEDVYMQPELIRAFLSDEIGSAGLLEGLVNGQFSIDGRAIGGALNLDADQELTMKLIAFINTYRLTNELEQDMKDVQDAVPDEQQINVEEQLKDADIDDIQIGDTSRSPILKRLLESQYRKYKESAFDNALEFADWRVSEEGVRIKTAYDAIKRIWGKGYQIFVVENGVEETRLKVPTQQQLNSEQGFQEFLDSKIAREEPLIQDVLNALDLNMDIFTTVNVPSARSVKPPVQGVGFDIVEIQTEGGSFYKIVDKKGGNLTQAQLDVISTDIQETGTYTDLSKAKRLLNILDKEVSDGRVFIFDGEQLSKGMSVYDRNTGEEFRINSSDNKGGIISLVPTEFYINDYKTRYNNSKTESELDFFTRYELEKLTFDTLPTNAYKLYSDRLSKVYPASLFTEPKGSLTPKQRYQYIVNALSPEDFQNIIVDFKVNNRERPDDFDDRYKGGPESIPNSYIRTQTERFTVELKLNKDATVRINNALAAQNIPMMEGRLLDKEGQGTIGFIPNDTLYFIDGNGKVVTPGTMTVDYAKNVIIPANSDQGMEAAIQQVAADFGKQAVLISFANEMIDSDQTVGTLGEGLKIIRNEGIPAYNKANNPEIPLNKLSQKTTVNGDIIIYDISRDAAGNMKGSPIVRSNLSGSAKLELAARIKLKLEDSGLWDKMISGDKTGKNGGYTDRYIMPIEQPGGLMTLATAKAINIEEGVVSEMMNDLLQQASLAAVENKTTKNGKSVIKDKGYNDKFHLDFIEKYGKFFISGPKGTNVTIDVAPDGALRADLFNKYTGKKGKVFYEKKAQQKENTPLGHMEQFFTDIINSSVGSTVGIESLTIANFRKSLPLDATIDTMMEDLVTKLAPEIRVGQSIGFEANSSSLKAAEDKGIFLARPRTELEHDSSKRVTDTESRREDPARERARAITNLGDKLTQEAADNAITKSEETGDVINDDVFFAFVDDNLSEVQKTELVQSIGQKIIAGTELSAREQDIRTALKDQIENYLTGSVNAEQKNDIDLTLIAQTPIDAINNQIAERESEISEQVGEKKKVRALRKDKIYQDLLKQREKIIGPANKILSPRLSKKDVEDLDIFLEWAKSNLPEFIRIGDIETLGNNLKAGGLRVGAFAMDLAAISGGLRTGGTLYTGASNGFRYHEAFHGVYRMLLTPAEQKSLLRLAKTQKRALLRFQGKSIAVELQRFRNSADTYTNMSDVELENRYYEEYMADEFETFKKSPSSSKADTEIKSFFTRLIEWFKRMFNSFNKSQLLTLFENIDSGKYAQASVVSNDFTLDTSPQVIVANAILPYEGLQVNSSKGYLYLDSNISNNLVSSMAASYVARKNTNTDSEITNQDIFEDVLEDFTWLYNKTNPINSKYNSSAEPSNVAAIEQLDRIHDALSFNATEDITKSPIYKSVFDVLELIDVQQKIKDDNIDQYENTEGLRNVTQFGKEAYMSGGLASLPTYLRQYLSTITMPYTDAFGNTQLESGEKLIVPINSYKTYNGIIKSVKNETSPLVILQRMYIFSLNNSNTKAAVERIFNDIGLDYHSISDISELQLPQQIKNPTLFNQITKGFTNYKVDWLFLQQDNTNEVISFSAAERDDTHTQNELWSQAYTTKSLNWKINPKTKDKALESLDAINDALTERKEYTDSQLDLLSRSLTENLYDSVGIKLSPLYMKYSILSATGQSNNAAQDYILQYNSEADGMTAVQAYWIRDIINADGDLFNSENDGAIARLKSLAINNAIFDETVGLSVFRDVNGNLVNAHQKPTFHLERVFDLNKEAEIDRLADDVFLANNYLLNNLEFLDMSDDNILKIQRLSGLKEVKTLDRSANLDSYQDGVIGTTDYGSFSPKQLLTTMINNYLFDYNSRSNTFKTKMDKGAVAPILIRIMESSNTNDQISLPIIKAINADRSDQGIISPEYIKEISNFVENEYNRIVRENNEEGNLPLQELVTKTGEIIQIPKTIPGYNIPDSDGVMRKNLMFNTKDLITQELRDSLEVSATQENPPSFKNALKEALGSVQIIEGRPTSDYSRILDLQLNIKINNFLTMVDNLGVDNKISRLIDKGLLDGVQGKVAEQKARVAALKLNITEDRTYNLKQIFLNDYLNTKSLNELLLGDQAMILEDSIKQIKRAKGQNAAGDSIYSPVSNPEFGVFESTEKLNAIILKEPTIKSEFSGKDIDRSDAQLYVTPKFHRHAQNSLGSLTKFGAQMLDKIEGGQELTADELYGPQGMAKTNQMLNSKKFVYFDGKVYAKFSYITLTEELTENNPELRQLYRDMVAMDNEYGGITFAGPESAFKMLKTNVQALGDNITQPSIQLDAKYFREQVKTKTNKEEITEQSQIKALATSEQRPDTPVSIETRPDLKTIKDVIREYNLSLGKRIILKFKNKRNLIYSFEGLMQDFAISSKNRNITPNLQVFLKYALNSLKASKASSNLMEFFSIDETTGDVKFNINNPISIAKAEQLFMSYFSKGVFQEKIPGHGLALVSDKGHTILRRIYSMEKNGRLGRNEVIRGAVPEGETVLVQDVENMGANYKFPSNGKGILVRDRLRYQLAEYKNGKRTGQYYSEAVMPAHSADIYSQLQNNSNTVIPDSVGKMFAVRIPSQDNHSSMNVKLVDFLPAYYGSSAMFPAELIEISGADFDIDTAYVQTKESYYDKKTGKFYAYGETPGRGYSDYVRYINQAVNKDTVYSQAVSSFEKQGSKLEDSYTDAELMASDFSDKAVKAASRLGLPITKQQYIKYVDERGQPYEAAYNNEVLDYKYALMGNEAVKDISVTPASLTAIENAYQELKKAAPEYVARLDNENIDVDSMTGKVISFEVNKGAAIGKAVSPNLYLSLLGEYGITLPSSLTFSLRGINYFGYGAEVNSYGSRIQDEISSIITMLTDNSKENFVAKLGMHPSAVGLATNAVALGIPLTDAVFLMNGKLVRDLFTEANNKVDKFDASFKTLVTRKLRALKKVDASPSVSLETMTKSVNSQALTKEEQKSILLVLNNLNTISSFTGAMSSITGMAGNGIGANFSDVQKRVDSFRTIGVLPGDSAPLIDIQPILKNSWVKSNIDIFNQIAFDLIPSTFITGTQEFNKIYAKVSRNLSKSKIQFTVEDQQKVKRDMLSFFTIQAYMQKTKSSEVKDGATLSNQLIYPNSFDNSIYTAIKRLTSADKGNFFLENFITMLPMFSETNNTGMNLIQANTWRSLDKDQKLDLQTSFSKLYGNPLLRKDAMTIVNYLMVKDGLQSARGTLLDAISPFVMDEYLQQINNVNEVFLTNKGWLETFGAERNELVNQFEDGYFRSASVNSKINTITYDLIEIGGIPTMGFNRKGYSMKKIEGTKAGVTLEYKIPENVRAINVLEVDKSSLSKFINVVDVISNPIDAQYSFFELDSITETKAVYIKTEMQGSYYQNGIGFMFGPRPSTQENRTNIRNKGDMRTEYAADQFDSMNFEDFVPPPNTIQNQALSNENATVEATENEINFTAEDTSKAVNIADIDTLNNLLGIGKPSETRQMQFGEARISLSTVDGKYDVQHSEFGALTEFGLDTYEEAVAIAKPFAEEAEVQTSGVEISSNAKGLAAALTNPTELAKSKGNLAESYPITFNGKNYKDVEAAYQALKDKSEARTKPTKENSDNYKLMVDLISAKLEQHPRLVSSIIEQGGVAWISSSTHQPTKQNTVWETGGQNWFVESLADAFDTTIKKRNLTEAVQTSDETLNREEFEKLSREAVEDEATGIVDAQENIPTPTEKQAQQIQLFDEEISNQYPIITSLYNSIFETPGVNVEAASQIEALENNNIDSLEAMIELYNSPLTNFESEEDFEDYVKKCILGI